MTRPAVGALVRLLKRSGDRIVTWRPAADAGYGDDLWDLVPLVGEPPLRDGEALLPTSVDGTSAVSIEAAEAFADSEGFSVLERPAELQESSGLVRWVSE